MRILFLAPQPFYEERGTLIAVDMLLRVFSERGDEVDLLTFHLGEDRHYPGIRTLRIKPWPAPGRVRPGLSAAKIWCDLFLSCKAFSLARKGRYDAIYAVEEAAFIALALGKIFRVPFIYDMDSSLADQVVEQHPGAAWLQRPFAWMESLPIRNAIAVVPMCDALSDRARQMNPGIVETLRDVSLVGEANDGVEGVDGVAGVAGIEGQENIRREHQIAGPILMYVGNLEPYQGIDLLLHALVQVRDSSPDATTVLIGGSPTDIDKYRAMAEALGIADRVLLLGPRPVSLLGAFLSQADILLSPRVKGINTPMKVYSYLDSGVPLVATNLPTHTQVMTPDVAMLADPEPAALARAICELINNPDTRARLAEDARSLVAREYSPAAFRRRAGYILDRIEQQLQAVD